MSVSCDDGPWKVIGSENYTKDGWKTLNFTNIRLSLFNLSFNASANFTFEGIVNKSKNITIPYDINLSWRNNSCTSKGWCNETFNYSIEVKAEKEGEVELQIKCEEDDWEPKGKRQIYNKTSEWQAMNWTNISKPCGEYEGNTSYKFVFYLGGKKNNETTPYTGPKLFIPINISFNNPTVKPEGGCIYSESDALKYFKIDKIFNYSVNMWANKNTTVKLIVTDPYGNKLGFERKEYATPGQGKYFFWNISSEELKIQSFGIWNYTFNYTYYDPHEDKEINKTWIWENETDGEGPEIYAVLSNLSIDPKYIVESGKIRYGDTFNVSYDVNGTKNLNITLLLIFDDKMEELRVREYTPPGKKDTHNPKWKNIDIWKYGKISKFFLGLKVEEVNHK